MATEVACTGLSHFFTKKFKIMKRRKFIGTTAAGVVVPSLLGKFGVKIHANPTFTSMINNDSDKVLVIINLAGGNDGLNTLIPYEKYDDYVTARPNIHIPENELLDLDGTEKWKLNPGMTGFRDLYNDGKLCGLQGVGYESHSGSHGLSSNLWRNGVMRNAPHYFTGWAARFLGYEYPDYPDLDNPPDHPPAIEIGGQSLIFQEDGRSMGLLLSTPNSFWRWWDAERDGTLDDIVIGSITDPSQIEDTFNEQYCNAKPNVEHLLNNNGITRELIGPVVQAYNNGTGNSEPSTNNNLEARLSIIAGLIAGGLKTKVYYLTADGGYDTHQNQVINGHNERLGILSTAIKNFMDLLNSYGVGDRVMGMTMSEFGRTTRENGNKGTDHARASCAFLFGNQINGDILGSNPTINHTSGANYIERQFDIRQIYASILKHWFCVDKTVVDTQILMNPFSSLPLFSNSPCCTEVPQAAISGNQNPQVNGSFTYSVPADTDVAYYWEIDDRHGTIQGGQFTNQITVQWNSPAQSSVKVFQIAD